MKCGFVRPRHALFACILLVYFAFLTRTYYWDGVLFSLDIESVYQGQMPAATLFHPNHLIYNAFGYAVFCVIRWFLPGLRAISVLQALNVPLSAAAGFVLFLVAKRTTNVRGVPFFCWVLFATGATWWKFSTDADAYIVCTLLLLLCALFMLRERPNLVAAGLCHATAMLFHELAIFTYAPVLAFVLFERRAPLTKRLTVALSYCAGTGCIVAGSYWLCYAQASHAVYPTLLSWATSYASDSGFTHSLGQIAGLYLTSYLKLFGGGRLSMVREFFSPLECIALLLCVALLVWGIRLFTQPAAVANGKADGRALLFLWTWFAGYAIFLAAWDPGSAFHKLFVWPAIVLLVGAYLANAQYTREHLRAFTVLAAALAAWNFGAFIYPRSHATADPVLVLARKIDRELPRNAVVYYRFFDPDDWYLDYFAPGRQWKRLPPGANGPALLQAGLAPVCLETTALDGFKATIDERLKWNLVNSSHNIRLECLKRSQ